MKQIETEKKTAQALALSCFKTATSARVWLIINGIQVRIKFLRHNRMKNR